MRRTTTSFSHKLLVIYRIEFILLLIVVTLIVSGSLYALLRAPDAGPVLRLGGAAGENSSLREINSEESVFSGIGRLRIPVAGQNAASRATMVLSIAFPYPSDDKAFTEELASHIIDFRTLATDYFSTLPSDSISGLGEAAAKVELLNRYNALLRLGKIETLYFSDLMIIE